MGEHRAGLPALGEGEQWEQHHRATDTESAAIWVCCVWGKCPPM